MVDQTVYFLRKHFHVFEQWNKIPRGGGRFEHPNPSPFVYATLYNMYMFKMQLSDGKRSYAQAWRLFWYRYDDLIGPLWNYLYKSFDYDSMTNVTTACRVINTLGEHVSTQNRNNLLDEPSSKHPTPKHVGYFQFIVTA